MGEPVSCFISDKKALRELLALSFLMMMSSSPSSLLLMLVLLLMLRRMTERESEDQPLKVKMVPNSKKESRGSLATKPGGCLLGANCH